MERPCFMRAGRAPTALALAVTAWFSSAAAAQPLDKDRHAVSQALDSGNDADPVQDKRSDLLIETQNASGTLGVALPLEIRLVRVRNVYIEAIKLLGLPRGVTISDSSNTYSSSSDNNDVDVSAWDLSKIQITQNDRRESSFSLAVAAIWTPEFGGHIDVASSRLSVHFAPDHRAHIAAADEPAEPEQPMASVGVEAPPVHVAASQAAASQAAASEVAATREAPAAQPGPSPAAPWSTVAIAGPAPARAPDPGSDGPVADFPRTTPLANRPTGPDPLVERAKDLIRRGDISGARRLLEHAQARNTPNATFLLAQTWDPALLRRWNVRGLRADPDLATELYARAAAQDRTDGRLLDAARR